MKTRKELSDIDMQTILNALALAQGIYKDYLEQGNTFTYPEQLQQTRVDEPLIRIRD